MRELDLQDTEVTNNTAEDFTEQEVTIRYEGINEDGFGIIPRRAMRDLNLTLEAKGMYAYFCSLAGGGATSFPSRKTILGELGLGKDRYYQHRKLLETYGYLKVENGFDSSFTPPRRTNTYIICSEVPVKTSQAPEELNETADVATEIVFEGVNNLSLEEADIQAENALESEVFSPFANHFDVIDNTQEYSDITRHLENEDEAILVEEIFAEDFDVDEPTGEIQPVHIEDEEPEFFSPFGKPFGAISEPETLPEPEEITDPAENIQDEAENESFPQSAGQSQCPDFTDNGAPGEAPNVSFPQSAGQSQCPDFTDVGKTSTPITKNISTYNSPNIHPSNSDNGELRIEENTDKELNTYKGSPAAPVVLEQPTAQANLTPLDGRTDGNEEEKIEFQKLVDSSVNRNLLGNERDLANTFAAYKALLDAGYSAQEIQSAWDSIQQKSRDMGRTSNYFPQLLKWLGNTASGGCKEILDIQRKQSTEQQSQDKNQMVNLLAAKDPVFAQLLRTFEGAQMVAQHNPTQDNKLTAAAALSAVRKHFSDHVNEVM